LGIIGIVQVNGEAVAAGVGFGFATDLAGLWGHFEEFEEIKEFKERCKEPVSLEFIK
jgi:hypothetical protein